jgi:hypothetical protein
VLHFYPGSLESIKIAGSPQVRRGLRKVNLHNHPTIILAFLLYPPNGLPASRPPQRTVFIYFWTFQVFFILSFFSFFLMMPVRYLFIFIGRRADIEYLFIFYWPPSSRYFFHFFILFIFS